MSYRAIFSAAVGVTCCALASTAGASTIATQTFDDLSGNFVANGLGTGGAFTALAVNMPGLRSSGDLSRLVNPVGTASFPRGFMTNPARGVANFSLSASVTITGVGVAMGSGTFTITDVDGDTITGTLLGSWIALSSNFIAFNGSLSGVNFNDTGSADTTFNGMAGTAFEMNNWPAPQPFDGAIVQLTFGSPNFFETSFSNRNTGVTMQQIPTPGALALLGLGGLAIARRRRA